MSVKNLSFVGSLPHFQPLTSLDLATLLVTMSNTSSHYERGPLKVLFYFFEKYTCFTMLCSFLLHREMDQLYVYIYSLTLEPLTPPHSTHLGHHRAPSWAPVLCCRFPLDIYFAHGHVYACQCYSPIKHHNKVIQRHSRVTPWITLAGEEG